ncbi:MAG: HK97-gp10 family putative phage morphogenesis protein [Janthinobacterium lividum]
MTKSIDGLEAFIDGLRSIKGNLRCKVAFSAALAGANVIKRRAKRNAITLGLRQSGALINNIAVKREREAPDGRAQYNLGVRHGRELGSKARVTYSIRADGSIRKQYVDDPFYWWYDEFGTKRHVVKGRKGRAVAFQGRRGVVVQRQVVHPGVTPRPFIGPAVASEGDAAVKAMQDRVLKELLGDG